MTTSDFETAAAHHSFSGECFNRVWELLDKPDRTADDDNLMISMCHASLFHWLQRSDCTPKNLSIGYWQLSRVYSVLRQADNARRYGELCYRYSQDEEPFYIGYALEALARAAVLEGQRGEAERLLKLAHDQVMLVTDAADRELLEKDLVSVQEQKDSL